MSSIQFVKSDLLSSFVLVRDVTKKGVDKKDVRPVARSAYEENCFGILSPANVRDQLNTLYGIDTERCEMDIQAIDKVFKTLREFKRSENQVWTDYPYMGNSNAFFGLHIITNIGNDMLQAQLNGAHSQAAMFIIEPELGLLDEDCEKLQFTVQHKGVQGLHKALAYMTDKPVSEVAEYVTQIPLWELQDFLNDIDDDTEESSYADILGKQILLVLLQN